MDIEQRVREKNRQLKDLIGLVKVDVSYAYETERLLDEKIGFMAARCANVLDFGKSSRHRFDCFRPGQAETADINRFEGYPEHVCDICDASTFPAKRYGGIVCNAIIEHVYDPGAAVKNMFAALSDNGVCLCYAPFLYRYHAPADLVYQDYFRFTRDGLAYLFRDFREVTLYPVRGRLSTAAKFGLPCLWKRVEKAVPAMNRILDRLGGFRDPLQTSGYVVWAVK
jgi:SAM-dependent methyltransferase